jgi:hypothetical protein
VTFSLDLQCSYWMRWPQSLNLEQWLCKLDLRLTRSPHPYNLLRWYAIILKSNLRPGKARRCIVLRPWEFHRWLDGRIGLLSYTYLNSNLVGQVWWCLYYERGFQVCGLYSRRSYRLRSCSWSLNINTQGTTIGVWRLPTTFGHEGS